MAKTETYKCARHTVGTQQTLILGNEAQFFLFLLLLFFIYFYLFIYIFFFNDLYFLSIFKILFYF